MINQSQVCNFSNYKIKKEKTTEPGRSLKCYIFFSFIELHKNLSDVVIQNMVIGNFD